MSKKPKPSSKRSSASAPSDPEETGDEVGRISKILNKPVPPNLARLIELMRRSNPKA